MSPSSTPSTSPFASPSLTLAMQTITEVMVKALEAPLRAQVEACVQAIVAEAAQDIHARIAAAVGQIQPINIPINLFTQPVLQPIPAVQRAAPTPDPAATITPAPQPEAEAEAETEAETETEAEAEAEAAEAERVKEKASASKAVAAKKVLNVTVVGLKPGQAHMIKNEFKFIHLRFITSDAGAGKQLKALAKTNDYVVQMVDFIRHAVGDSVKSVHGNWICISGGMTKLREKLEEMNNRQKTHITALGAA